METVAVLGGGTMGGGIAGHLARAGLEVRLADASAELAEQAREALLARTRGHVEAGLLDDVSAPPRRSRPRPTSRPPSTAPTW